MSLYIKHTDSSTWQPVDGKFILDGIEYIARLQPNDSVELLGTFSTDDVEEKTVAWTTRIRNT